MQNYPGTDYINLGVTGWIILIFLVLVWYLWPRKEELSDEDKKLIEWYQLELRQYRLSLLEREQHNGRHKEV